jgi:PadR family transcriptional regulator PadR
VQFLKETLPTWAKEIQKGYLKLFVLMLLSKKPLHGYEIMDNVEGLTLGFWRPTAGGVYPILKKMEASGLVKGGWEKIKGIRRKIYNITPEGKNLISRALEKQKIITDAIRRLQSDFAFEFLDISPSKIPKFPSPHSFFSSFGQAETLEEKVKRLKYAKSRIEEAISRMETHLRKVDQKLIELKKTKIQPRVDSK